MSLAGTRITNANLSHLEIDGAQLGGAHIRNIGIPREGEPHYDPETAGKPIRFENADLRGTTFTGCNLSGVDIAGCSVGGMKIDGIPVDELLEAYRQRTAKL